VRPIRSLGARLSLALAGVVVVALAIVYVIVVPPLERSLVNSKLDQLSEAVERRRPEPGANLSDRVRTFSETTNSRVVFLEPLGAEPPPWSVTADSRQQMPSGDIQFDTVAARAWLTGETQRGNVSREGERFAEVAVIATVERRRGVMLFSASLDDTLANVRLVQRRVLVAGAVALLVALVLGVSAASVFAGRLRRLERAAERIAGGMLDEPVVDRGADEVAQLAAAFERMRRRLAQLEHARREFVANASHELRTPIFSLSGFLELLADEELDDDTRSEFLTSMREQIDRLTRLASELLDLSRLDAGQLRFEREPVDLAGAAEVLADEFHVLASASEHALDVTAEPDVPLADADGERVLQIGRALLENALRHTPAGTSVSVRVTEEGGAPTLAVEDDGPGIAPEHVDHVFDRFYRVDGTRASGSGLGLAIAHELAELMGGRLAVTSRPGATSFRLVLGAAPAAERRSTEALAS
jgi:two-component system OmpR family sensor kinase